MIHIYTRCWSQAIPDRLFLKEKEKDIVREITWSDSVGGWTGGEFLFGCQAQEREAILSIGNQVLKALPPVADPLILGDFGAWTVSHDPNDAYVPKDSPLQDSPVTGEPSAPAIRRVRKVACISLGDWTGELIECPSCQGTVKLKIMSCNIHNKCTLEKPLHGVQCCQLCKDYNPKSVV